MSDIEKKYPTIYNLYDSYRRELSQKYNKLALFIKIGNFYELYSYKTFIGWIIDGGCEYLRPKELQNLDKIADILNIQKIIRNKHKPVNNKNPIMIGFPIQSLDKHKSKLLENNYSVIIIENFDMYIGVKKTEFFESVMNHRTVYYENNDIVPQPVITQPTYVDMKLVMRNLNELKVK